MARPRDMLVHLVTRQLPTFARLGPLRDLDLKFVGVNQIVAGHAKACRCDLLDGATGRGSIWTAFEAFRVFATLARIRAAAYGVHSNSDGLMRVLADRPEGHGTGGQALEYVRFRFDLINRDRSLRFEVEQPTNAVRALVFKV